jgi:hypothetical protein
MIGAATRNPPMLARFRLAVRRLISKPLIGHSLDVRPLGKRGERRWGYRPERHYMRGGAAR